MGRGSCIAHPVLDSIAEDFTALYLQYVFKAIGCWNISARSNSFIAASTVSKLARNWQDKTAEMIVTSQMPTMLLCSPCGAIITLQ